MAHILWVMRNVKNLILGIKSLEFNTNEIGLLVEEISYLIRAIQTIKLLLNHNSFQ